MLWLQLICLFLVFQSFSAKEVKKEEHGTVEKKEHGTAKKEDHGTAKKIDYCSLKCTKHHIGCNNNGVNIFSVSCYQLKCKKNIL